MSYSRELASFIHGVAYEKLPEEVVAKTKDCVLDWLGAVLNAYEHPNITQKYINFALEMGGVGNLSILGSDQKTNPLWAAFANGALGHISEVDDGHRESIMHIGTVVFPVIWALGAEKGITGHKAIEAAVAGYDLAIRVGECLGQDHYTIWHTTATAGTFGATAAAAKILDLSEEQIVWALAHAGAQASGLWQFLLDGQVEAKPFHPGKAVLSGIIAARLAQQNIPGPEHIFEGEKGFCKAVSPSSNYAKLNDRLGTLYKVSEVNFKGYPTCGQTHSMIDATQKILKKTPLDPEKIKRIEARVYQKAIDVAGILNPRTLEEAKFSIPFCLAFLITKKEITFVNMTEETLKDSTIQNVMKKVELVFDEDVNKKFPKCRPCKVSIELVDGTILTEENLYRRGDPETPMSREEMIDKFNQLTSYRFSEQKRESIVRWTYDMDKINAFDFESLL
ncbi:MAG: MmgE/PrpD family protein [Aminobacterium sp.]|uniref:MmgE/PrpD family protein n=1 Tax=unclassified Aminobacterium TaxID=2685012 RepID=UPI001BCF33C8|nr:MULTISPECIES: MmgE/PrpD family protein [unclassified Aminobacterium]MDD2207673.1 MmgE/PrpD family protein [Aminobacterium sp.]MDD3426289.1 MmgE/PrpD family protein [Aminobacterium sp.]MDD3708497.1 MmgE/PrpD family protein [Aminobacterium sp.]MDD4229699.1 MmgE/PrpD family protein [Aminobacterium sp.]MDD4552506.1 MmgE/PrpD family protein [Aminobacterium sp.]